jgi:cellulose synthase/poly-beta-1,6-N-acetylglucosamine synthase-like glycosyltransferase
MPRVRLYELIPAALTWATLLAMVIFSWLLPVWVSIFIILFDTYWLLKTVYLSFHLRATFNQLRANMKTNWLARVQELPARESSWQDLYHLVILPMYNEPYEVVRESFESLTRAHYPLDKFIVVLALEERAGDAAQEVGRRIAAEFGGTADARGVFSGGPFHNFLITTHPGDLPGEIPGKGSNEAWAAARAKEMIIDPTGIDYKKILVSVFDVDTQIFPEYFGRLTYVFLTAPDPLRAIYQPVPLFTNNIYEAPALARVVSFSCTFWQMMQQSRPERLTSFSSQSIPFQALVDIGFWNRNIVSEDSQIFWQGYFRYSGDFRVEPLFFPVSMDAPVAPTFWGALKNIYKQQRRWAWGAENVPYLLEGFAHDAAQPGGPKIPRRKRWYWTFNAIEGYHSWATNSLMIFALGWLPLFLGGRHFGTSLLAYTLPHITRWIISLSMIGVASSAIMALLFLPPRKNGNVGAMNYLIYVLQWILMPFTLIAFGAIPGIEAQTRLALGGRARLGFWVTPKGRKVTG